MTTVTYHNQPGIHATLAHVPLAGTAYLYKVNKLLWPKEVESVLRDLLESPSLHICSGKSMLGDCRLDLYEATADVKADAARLPFANRSWKSVLIDPPYNGVFQWNHDMLSELARIARQRIIFQHWFMPTNKWGQFKKAHRFLLSSVFAWQPRTYFGRAQIISVMDAQELLI